MEATDHMKPLGKGYRPSEENAAAEAVAKRRRFARGFARQVIVWAVTCAFLAVVNWLTSPHYWWVLWVIGGWGLQLLIAFALYLFDGEENETTQHH